MRVKKHYEGFTYWVDGGNESLAEHLDELHQALCHSGNISG